MGNEQINSLLKGAGIAAGAITVITLTLVVMTAYKNYFDVKKCKLEIIDLKRRLAEQN